jgi:protein O-mannosyl-transferase
VAVFLCLLSFNHDFACQLPRITLAIQIGYNYNDLAVKNPFKTLTNEIVFLILLIFGSVVYFNSLFNGFVSDDVSQIRDNTLVHSLSNILLFFTNAIFLKNTGSNSDYRPIQSVLQALIYTFSGSAPFTFHVFSVFLHITNAFLVFFVLKHFVKRPFAFFLSILFLVHPMNQEAVGWASSSADLLFFFFGMAALIVSMNFKGNWKQIILINVFLTLSFLSKETGLAFVPLVLIFPFFNNKKTISWKYIASIIVTAGCYIFLRFYELRSIYSNPDPMVPISQQPFPSRLLNTPAIILYYLKTFFFPYMLSFDQQWVVKTMDFRSFYFPLFLDCLFFALIGLFGFFIFNKKKSLFTSYIFFVLWFLLGLVFYLQIIHLDMIVADRWFYFPIVGLLGLLGTAVSLITIKNDVFKKGIVTVAIVYVGILTIRTMVRNTNWVDNLTLIGHDVETSDSPHLAIFLNVMYEQTGQMKKIKSPIVLAVPIDETKGQNWYNLGTEYFQWGYKDISEKYFMKSIHEDKFHKAYKSLAIIYIEKDHNPKASKEILLQGLQQYPNDPLLLALLSITEYTMSDKQTAIATAQKLQQISPQYAQTLLNLIKNNQPITIPSGY